MIVISLKKYDSIWASAEDGTWLLKVLRASPTFVDRGSGFRGYYLSCTIPVMAQALFISSAIIGFQDLYSLHDALSKAHQWTDLHRAVASESHKLKVMYQNHFALCFEAF